MTYQFTIQSRPIKRNQVNAIHIIFSLLLIVIGFIGYVTPFAYNILRVKEKVNRMDLSWINYICLLIALLGFLILVMTLFFNKKWRSNKKNTLFRIIEISSFTFLTIYCILQKWYLPTVYVGFALLGSVLTYFIENKNPKPYEVTIDDLGVKIEKSFGHTKWKWSQLDKLIIKNNLLTLISVQGNLYQYIIHNINNNIILNSTDFAHDKIEKAKPERIKDNW